jgi:guanylate kinase
MPEFFQYPLPHTSRPQRKDEVNGVKYHFDTKDKILANQRDFVEIGEHKSNYYGVSLASVKKIIGENKHAMLDCSSQAVRRITKYFHVAPLCILVRPESLQACSKITNGDRLDEMRGEMQRAEQAENFMYNLITARITEFNDYHSLFEQVVAAVKAHMTVLVNH